MSDTLKNKAAIGFVAGAALVGAGAVFWPFLAPAVRRHCLPYIPATDAQVNASRFSLSCITN